MNKLTGVFSGAVVYGEVHSVIEDYCSFKDGRIEKNREENMKMKMVQCSLLKTGL